MNRVRPTLRPCLAFAGICCLGVSVSLFAQQQSGQLRLEVRDTAGGSVAARGEILSQGNDFQRSFQVASDGHYLLQGLPFGVYRLSLQAPGFAAWSDVVEVHSIVPVNVNVSLGVATVTSEVQVNDERTLVDPTATGSLFSIGRESIQENLSSQPGRDLLDLTASQPGWLFEANGVLHPRGSEYDVQFVVDGQPVTQNRSPAFAPDMDSDEVESLRVLTANFPAEYGRKLGGVVEVTTDKSVPLGWHGELDAAGGSFDHLSGTAGISFSVAKDRFSARASGLHSDRYLDPPVFENYTNRGNSGGILAQYEHEFTANDRLRITFLHDTLGYMVPNDLVQQHQLFGPQRQDASSTENGGQVYFQRSISPILFLTVSGGVRESSFALRSNLLSTPVIVEQNRGYTEGYLRGDIAGHHGHHDWKAGIDSFFTPVHEALAYHITDPSQFDPGTQINFQFRQQKWDLEPSCYIQDQMHYGHWNLSAGIRLDDYSFVVDKVAVSPRLGLSYFFPSWSLLVHAAYDRVFQTPAMENLLLASSPELDSVSPVVLRLPVLPAQGNFYEIGLTKALFGKFRLDANVFRRNFHNYADDDVLLQTGVSFPISYSKARITGEEVRFEVSPWGRFSGFVSYANQSGLGQGPVTGGLFIGSDAQGVLTDTGKFAVSQDQRNTLRARLRFQATPRWWLAMATQYGSGLPAELGDTIDLPSLIAQFGERVVSRVNLDRGRVDPNFSLDLALGAELYRKELRTLQFQLQVTNVTDRLNIINFASLFSGTAVGAPRMFSARLRLTF
jgi:hypothetical protein